MPLPLVPAALAVGRVALSAAPAAATAIARFATTKALPATVSLAKSAFTVKGMALTMGAYYAADALFGKSEDEKKGLIAQIAPIAVGLMTFMKSLANGNSLAQAALTGISSGFAVKNLAEGNIGNAIGCGLLAYNSDSVIGMATKLFNGSGLSQALGPLGGPAANLLTAAAPAVGMLAVTKLAGPIKDALFGNNAADAAVEHAKQNTNALAVSNEAKMLTDQSRTVDAPEQSQAAEKSRDLDASLAQMNWA